GENPFQTFCFRLADEKNVAALDFFYTVKPLNFQLSILYDFIVDNLVQGLAEGVCAQDSDDEGILLGRKGLRGPFNELGQVVEERGIDVVLLEGLGMKLRRKKARPQEKDQQNIQHPTSNAEHRTRCELMPSWKLGVGCSMLDVTQKLHETLP